MKGLFANTKHDEPLKYKRIQLANFSVFAHYIFSIHLPSVSCGFVGLVSRVHINGAYLRRHVRVVLIFSRVVVWAT